MPSKFVHLHSHSHYSLLEALPKTKDLLKHVKGMEMDSVAITDNGTMYGAIEFYQKAADAGIKPIIGVDFYVAQDGRLLKRARIDTRPQRLVCLAETNEGYQNLIKLSSIGFLEGFYYKPRIDKEVLKLHCKGLIALSGGHMGEIDEFMHLDRVEEAKAAIKFYVEIFGEGNYFLELVDRPEIAEQEAMNAKLIALGREMNVPVVATKNTFFLKPGDVEAWKILNCIKGQKTLEQYERMAQFDFDASMVSGEYMEDRFADVPEAIENTRRIADRCNVTLDLGKWNFPKFEIPEGTTFRGVLTERTFDGLKEKVGELSQVQIDRINYELDIIDQKGFCPYFLIVSDFLSWSRENGIVTTTRGSAAGSIVAYATDISAIDPLLYKLPFERFLNPERPSAPDIDADFADNRRDEVLDYVRQKYGADKVAQICTFGTMLARGSVRDVGRSLGFPYAMVDVIAKLVPMGSQGFPMTLTRAIEESPDLKRQYDTDANVRRMIDLARQIEGCARHVSVHAAGTVISPTELTDFTPLQIDTKEGKMITQYEMKAVEAAGLVKMDFLGIRNLSILGDAVHLVKKTKGVDVVIDRLPTDDKKTFELLATGKTMGVFQLNGDGMTKYLMELKPERIEDIMAMVALYRPGPIESIPEYIKRKHNPSLIHFLDPRMKDILNMSYGVIVYQDDVMLIAIHLGGYSWLEADKLRKAMGKKIPEEMAKQKIKLHDGLIQHGMSEKKAKDLWNLIEPFAAYGFNKCLTGETHVMDPKDGSYRTMKELFDRGFVGSVASMCEDQTIQKQKRLCVVENGKKNVLELVTRSGRRIRATANHPFLRFEGWSRLDALSVGQRIAVPRRLPIGSGTKTPLKAIRALGLLIAEGNLCHPHGVYYYSKDEQEVKDFVKYLAAFPGVRSTIDRSKSATAVYVGQKKTAKENALRGWLGELGLMGKKATEKVLPEFVYRMNEEELVELIAGMWQGDGCVHNDQYGQIYYATSSKVLAEQLQHLLLRLGILSTVHRKQFRYRGGHKIGWTIHVSGFEQVRRFAETIGTRLLSNKRKPLEQIIRRLKKVYAKQDGIVARGTKDIIPASVLSIIDRELFVSGMSVEEVAKKTGRAIRLFWNDKRRIGYSRATIHSIAKCIGSKKLNDIANSDLYWDEIVSITPDGREMTYDLEVPKMHNFIANDFVVHNSHAASYGMVAYETAFMKANYPAEYMTALMTAESGDLEKIAEAVSECRRMEIEVLPPDINESLKNFTYIDDHHIRFGLLVIKNLGEEVIESILSERKAGGDFKDLADFVARVAHRAFNKKSLEALIKTGALDRFAERNQLLENLDRLLLHNKSVQKEKTTNQPSLFAAAASTIPQTISLRPAEPAKLNTQLAWEKELLGLYVSGHPYAKIHEFLEGTLMHMKDLPTQKDGIFVYAGGIIITPKTIVTKKGDPMAFIGLEDMTGKQEVIVFPKTFATVKDVMVEGTICLVSAKVSKREGEEAKLLANSFMIVNEENMGIVKEMLAKEQWMAFPDIVTAHVPPLLSKERAGERSPVQNRETVNIKLQGKPTAEMIESVRTLLQSKPGATPVCLLVESGGSLRRIETEYRVSPTESLVRELSSIVGAQNVEVEK